MELDLDLDERQEKLYRTSIFLGKLIIAGIVFRLFILFYPDTTSLQVSLADLTAETLRLTGIKASSTGIFVLTEKFTYEITRDCLGWKSVAALLGLTFATPKKTDLRFVVAGIAAIGIANIVRLLTTIYLDMSGIISFDIIHGILWRWGLTAVVLGIWVLWYRERL